MPKLTPLRPRARKPLSLLLIPPYLQYLLPVGDVDIDSYSEPQSPGVAVDKQSDEQDFFT